MYVTTVQRESKARKNYRASMYTVTKKREKREKVWLVFDDFGMGE